jgi:hypothetical protein
MYLASSDTDPDKTYRRGFSFEELTKMIQKNISTSVVVILDCCYSGSTKISKGHEEDAAKIGRTAIDEKSRKLKHYFDILITGLLVFFNLIQIVP